MANRELLVTLGLNATSYVTNVRRAKALTKELDKEFDLISSSVKDFENSLDGLGKKSKYLTDRIEVLTAQSQLYTKRLQESQEGLNNAQANADKYRKSIEQLQKEMAGMDKSSDTYKKQKEDLKALQQLLNKAEKEIVTYNQRILDSKSNYSQTQAELQKYSKELSVTKDKMDALKVDNKFDEMNKDLQKSDEQFKRIQSSVDGFGKNMESLLVTEKHYTEQKKKTNQLLDEYTKEINNSKSKIGEYTDEVKKLQVELEEWESRMKGMDNTSSDFAEVRQEVERLRQAYSNANSALEFHSDRVETLGKKYDVAKQKMSNMDGVIDKTKKSMNSLKDVQVFDKLQDDIKKLEDEIQSLDNAFLITSTTMGKYETSVRGLADKKDYLKNKIILLDDSIEKMNTTYTKHFSKVEELENKHKELSSELEKSRKELNAMSTANPRYEQLAIEVGQAENKLESLNAEIKEHRSQLSSLDRDIASTTAEYNNLSRELITLDAQFVSSKLETFGNSMKTVGQNVTNLGQALTPLSVAFAGVSGAMVKTGMDFQQQMRNVGVLTGETGAELEKTLSKLEEKARSVGKTTRYSSTEAGEGLEYLILAGYDAEQAISSLDTVVSLASVGKMDMKTSSDLLTDSLGSLGSVTKNTAGEILTMEEYANQIAVTSTKANSSVEDLMRAFITVGGQADNMNIPLSTANTLLGILADQGFKAEQAGNSLSSILINMTQATGQSAKAMEKLGVSAFDAEGNIRPIEKVLFDIKKALKGFDDEQKEIQLANMLGGKTQAKTLMKLLNGISDETADFTGKYKELRDELDKGVDASSLINMAKEIEDTLQGDLYLLKSSIDGLFQDMFTTAEPALRKFVQNLTKFVGELQTKWNKLDEDTQKFVLKMLSLGSVIAPALIALGSLISFLGSVSLGLKSIVDFFGIFKKGGADIENTTKTIEQSSNIYSKLVENMGKWSNSLKNTIFPTITGFFSGMGRQIGSFFTASLLPIISGALSSAGTWIAGALSTIGGWIATGLGAIASFISTAGIWIAIAVAVASLLAVVVKNWDAIKEKTIEIWNNVSDWLGKKWSEISENLKNTWTTLKSNVEHIWNSIGDWLSEKWTNIVQKSGEIWQSMKDTVKNAIEKTKETIERTWETVVTFFKQAPEKIKQALEKGFSFMGELGAVIVGNFIGAIITAFANVSQIVAGVGRVLQGAFDVIVGVFTLNGDKIKQGFSGIFDGVIGTIKDVAHNVWTAGVGMIDNLTQLFGVDFKAIADNIAQWVSDIGNKISDWISSTAEQIWNGISTWGTNIKTTFDNMWLDFSNWCSQMWTSLGDWLSNMVITTLAKMEEWRVNVINALTYVKDNFWTWVETFLLGVGMWLANMVATTINKLEEWRVNILQALTYIKENFWTWVGEFISKVGDWLSQVVSKTKSLIEQWKNNIKNVLTNIKQNFWTWVGEFVNKVAQWGRDTATKAQQAMKDFGNKIQQGLKDAISKAKQFVTDFISALADLPKKLFNLGKEMVTNLWNGFKNSINTFKTNVKNAVSNVIGGIKFWSLRPEVSIDTPDVDGISPMSDLSSTYSMSINPIMGRMNIARSPLIDMFKDVFDISNYKTSGGFYEPQPVVVDNTKDVENDNRELITMLIQQNQLLTQLLSADRSINVGVQVDGRQIAKASAKYIENEINIMKSRSNRLGGRINV